MDEGLEAQAAMRRLEPVREEEDVPEPSAMDHVDDHIAETYHAFRGWKRERAELLAEIAGLRIRLKRAQALQAAR